MGAHWIAILVLNDIATDFDSFGDEFIPQEIKKFIGNQNITTMLCGYLRIRFINFLCCNVKICKNIPSYFLLNNMKRMVE